MLSIKKMLVYIILINIVISYSNAETVKFTNLISIYDMNDSLNKLRTDPDNFAEYFDSSSNISAIGLSNGDPKIAEIKSYLSNKSGIQFPILVPKFGLTLTAFGYSINASNGTANSDVKTLYQEYHSFSIDPSSFVGEAITQLAASNQINNSDLVIMNWLKDSNTRDLLFTSDLTNIGIGIYPFTENSIEQDQVTLILTNDAECIKCDTLSDKVKTTICWTQFSNGNDICDAEDINSDEEEVTSEQTTFEEELEANILQDQNIIGFQAFVCHFKLKIILVMISIFLIAY